MFGFQKAGKDVLLHCRSCDLNNPPLGEEVLTSQGIDSDNIRTTGPMEFLWTRSGNRTLVFVRSTRKKEKLLLPQAGPTKKLIAKREGKRKKRNPSKPKQTHFPEWYRLQKPCIALVHRCDPRILGVEGSEKTKAVCLISVSLLQSWATRR